LDAHEKPLPIDLRRIEEICLTPLLRSILVSIALAPFFRRPIAPAAGWPILQVGPAMRAENMRDVTDLFTDLQNGTLPAVSYVKPDGTMDGHPASSKWGLFEAFAQNIITLA
jgi:hypothetical protein